MKKADRIVVVEASVEADRISGEVEVVVAVALLLAAKYVTELVILRSSVTVDTMAHRVRKSTWQSKIKP